MNSSAEKSALRRQMRDVLRAMPDSERDAASQRICERLAQLWAAHPEWHAQTTAVFFPSAQEPQIEPFARKLQGTVAAPHGVGGERFLTVRDWQQTRRGIYGIREPVGGEGAQPVLPESFRMVLVPGLAFDTRGHRLGRGGGWYDRALSRVASDATFVGVCFERQIVEVVPTQAHDVGVHALVTEARAYFV